MPPPDLTAQQPPNYGFSASIAAATSASLRAEFFAPAVNAVPERPSNRRKIISPSVGAKTLVSPSTSKAARLAAICASICAAERCGLTPSAPTVSAAQAEQIAQ